MNGNIHFLINKFIEEQHSKDALKEILERAGVANKMYLGISQYPDEEVKRIVQEAAKLLNASVNDIMYQFGKFIAPIMANKYSFLIKPNWKTKEFLLNTEGTIHKTVKLRNQGAMPPMLKFEDTGENTLKFVYDSKRNMVELALGMMHAVAEIYNERLVIHSRKLNHSTIMDITIHPN